MILVYENYPGIVHSLMLSEEVVLEIPHVTSTNIQSCWKVESGSVNTAIVIKSTLSLQSMLFCDSSNKKIWQEKIYITVTTVNITIIIYLKIYKTNLFIIIMTGRPKLVWLYTTITKVNTAIQKSL